MINIWDKKQVSKVKKGVYTVETLRVKNIDYCSKCPYKRK